MILLLGSHMVAKMVVPLEQLFSLCRELKLKLHPEKCRLFLRTVRLLGHMLTKEDIHPMDQLLQRIRSTRRPQNKDHVKACLGVFGDYQKSIPSFTELTDALQQMLSKEALFSWGDKQEKVLIKLRNSLQKKVL